MTAPKVEYQQRIADVRNSLADAINQARYRDDVTVLTSRGKRVAALVSMDFYARALEALGEERVLVEKEHEEDDVEKPRKRVMRRPKRPSSD